MPKNKDLSSRQKAKLEFAESLIPEITKLRKETGISMTQAIIEVLKRKGITAKEDIEYCKKVVPSLSGKRGAWVKEKKKVDEAIQDAKVQKIIQKEERKKEKKAREGAQEREKLPLLRAAGLLDDEDKYSQRKK